MSSRGLYEMWIDMRIERQLLLKEDSENSMIMGD